MNTYVILNQVAQAGKSAETFDRLKSNLPKHELFVIRSADEWKTLPAWIESKMSEPARWIVAGGDGSVHSVLNLLYANAEQKKIPSEQWPIGLIALGSSNDYHKRHSHRISNLLRIDFDRTSQQELLEVEITSGSQIQKRYSFLNVGVGITAQGNWIFSHSPLIRQIKSWSVQSAIQLAALRAFFSKPHTEATISLDELPPRAISIANLSVFMNPHFSGSFRYPIAQPLNSGKFGVAWVEEAPLHRLTPVFLGLMRGQFTQSNTRHLGLHREIQIAFSASTPVEIDGELWDANSIRIRIAPRKVLVCL